jgi:hypothetical protein
MKNKERYKIRDLVYNSLKINWTIYFGGDTPFWELHDQYTWPYHY